VEKANVVASSVAERNRAALEDDYIGWLEDVYGPMVAARIKKAMSRDPNP
jgi:hypothetical protein